MDRTPTVQHGSKIQIVWIARTEAFIDSCLPFTQSRFTIYRLNGPAPFIYEFADFTDTTGKNCPAQKAHVHPFGRRVIDSRDSGRKRFLLGLPENKRVLLELLRKLRSIRNRLCKDFATRETLKRARQRSNQFCHVRYAADTHAVAASISLTSLILSFPSRAIITHISFLRGNQTKDNQERD